jgi:hypothetical protein
MAKLKRHWKKLLGGLLALPVVLIFVLNIWFFSGARIGYSQWTDIEEQARKNSAHLGEDGVPGLLVNLATQVDENELKQSIDYLNSEPKDYAEYLELQNSPEFANAMKTLETFQKETSDGLYRENKVEFLPGHSYFRHDEDIESKVRELLLAQANLSVRWLGTQREKDALDNYRALASQAAHFPKHETLYSTSFRLRLLERLAGGIIGEIHNSDLHRETLRELQDILAGLSEPPPDVITSAGDQLFVALTIADNDDQYVPLGFAKLFPGLFNFAMRSHRQTYLKYRKQLSDYRQMISVYDSYRHALEEMPGFVRQQLTPLYLAEGPYQVKRTWNIIRATIIMLELEIYKRDYGRYPKTLTELEKSGFTLPEDAFNKDGFEYQNSEKPKSFSLRSKSYWHTDGSFLIHPIHEHKN